MFDEWRGLLLAGSQGVVTFNVGLGDELRALLLATLGRHAEARDAARRAIELATLMESPSLLVRSEIALGRALVGLGDSTATDVLRRAISRAADTGSHGAARAAREAMTARDGTVLDELR